jgi:hypothetical protein
MLLVIYVRLVYRFTTLHHSPQIMTGALMTTISSRYADIIMSRQSAEPSKPLTSKSWLARVFNRSSPDFSAESGVFNISKASFQQSPPRGRQKVEVRLDINARERE